jgi:hypothetical protein
METWGKFPEDALNYPFSDIAQKVCTSRITNLLFAHGNASIFLMELNNLFIRAGMLIEIIGVRFG